MLGLLACLRAIAFKTFIVSGGGAAFMRVWTLETYDVPPERGWVVVDMKKDWKRVFAREVP